MSVTERKTWAGVEFEVESDAEELAGWLMMQDCGATACEIKPGPSDGRVVLRASFDAESLSVEDMQLIATTLLSHHLIADASALSTYGVPQEDWLAKWKEGFKPFPIGEKLLICPVWEQETAAPIAQGRTLLLIEPGMAFGTGLHPTTRFCLRSVERDNLGPKILDVGTGSGILAIAAVLMDESLTITAIDNDPVSIKVAEENCQLNGVENRIELLVGTTEVIVGRVFDDLLSNLTCEVIVLLLPDYRRILKPGGRVICAGVLLEKAEKLEAAAQEHGFEVLVKEPEGMWCGLILKMKA